MLAIFPDNRPQRSFETVASGIRTMILEGALCPGDKLPSERNLSATFRVGRNAVREAMRTLEQAGIVHLRTGKAGGAFVTAGRPDVISGNMRDLLQLGNISCDNLWEARLLLTDIVVQLAVSRMSQDDIAALEANVKQAFTCHETGQQTEQLRCNRDFHVALTVATSNPLIAILMTSVSDLAPHFSEQLSSNPSKETLLSRLRFIEAVKIRDVASAIAEMRGDLIRVHDYYQQTASDFTGGHNGRPMQSPGFLQYE